MAAACPRCASPVNENEARCRYCDFVLPGAAGAAARAGGPAPAVLPPPQESRSSGEPSASAPPQTQTPPPMPAAGPPSRRSDSTYWVLGATCLGVAVLTIMFRLWAPQFSGGAGKAGEAGRSAPAAPVPPAPVQPPSAPSGAPVGAGAPQPLPAQPAPEVSVGETAANPPAPAPPPPRARPQRSPPPAGPYRGTVYDLTTLLPLGGVHVIFVGSGHKAEYYSLPDGRYRIDFQGRGADGINVQVDQDGEPSKFYVDDIKRVRALGDEERIRLARRLLREIGDGELIQPEESRRSSLDIFVVPKTLAP